MTYLGGRNRQLRLAVKQALAAAAFPVADGMRFPGIDPKNTCNRNCSGMGVPLEISAGMRRRLFVDLSRLRRNRVTGRFMVYVLALKRGLSKGCRVNPP